MTTKQINFNIDTELFKSFSKKCIDLDKNKTETIIELIKEFVKKK